MYRIVSYLYCIVLYCIVFYCMMYEEIITVSFKLPPCLSTFTSFAGRGCCSVLMESTIVLVTFIYVCNRQTQVRRRLF